MYDSPSVVSIPQDNELAQIIIEIGELAGGTSNPAFKQKLESMADKMEHLSVAASEAELKLFFEQYPDSFAPLIILLIRRRKTHMGDIDRKTLSKINTLGLQGADSQQIISEKFEYFKSLLEEHEQHYSPIKRWLNRLIKVASPLASINGFTGGRQFAEMWGLDSTLTLFSSIYGYQSIFIAFAAANIPKDHVDKKGFSFASASAIPSVIMAYGAATAEFDNQTLEVVTALCNFIANIALDTRSYAEGLNAIQLFKLWYKSKTPKQKKLLAASFVGLSILSLVTLIPYILGAFDFVGRQLGTYPINNFEAVGVYALGGVTTLGNIGMYSMLMMTLFRKKLTIEHAMRVLRSVRWTVNIPRQLYVGETPFRDLWANLNRDTAIDITKTGLQVYMGGAAFVAYSGMAWAAVTRILLWSYCWMSLSQPSHAESPVPSYCNGTMVNNGTVVYPELYSYTSSAYEVPTVMDMDETFGTLVTVVAVFLASLAGMGGYENYARFGDTVYGWLASLVKNSPGWGSKVLSVFQVIRTWISSVLYPGRVDERSPLLASVITQEPGSPD